MDFPLTRPTALHSILVVAERIPSSSQEANKALLNERFRKLASGLEASAHVEGFTKNGFVKVEVEGEDSEVLGELIKRRLGIAPENASELGVDDNFKAYVTGIDQRGQSVEVDIGPASLHLGSEITRQALMAQLCDGRATPIDRIARAYCLQEDVPVLVRITRIDRDRRHLEAWISDDQIARFKNWRHQRFHRIIAVGATQERLRQAIRTCRVERDVIDAEELAFMASSLVCKLGTEAPGIIAKIGRHVGNTRLYAFLPEKIDELQASSQ